MSRKTSIIVLVVGVLARQSLFSTSLILTPSSISFLDMTRESRAGRLARRFRELPRLAQPSPR